MLPAAPPISARAAHALPIGVVNHSQVRAFHPHNVVILREGERALLQAELRDADGRGMPSTARLLRAVLLATP